ncbi:MAG TPA: hypothetical protein VFU05_13520 [Cyclobacteriaceae bacterium]|nr:hypothetical protein [Cyclobacteriaceae bacterium]
MSTLKKYVFEVIVIFIGITISFIFEEWRNSRQDEQKEREQYVLLLGDIKSDSLDIAEIFEGLNFEQPRMDSILRKGNYEDIERFSIDMCASFAFIKKQNLIKSFQSIGQSGDLKLFKSKDLINKCNNIISRQNQLNVAIDAEADIWVKYRSYLSKTYPDLALFCIRYQSKGGIKGKITDREINAFLKDAQIMIYFNDLLWISKAIKWNSTQLDKDLSELKALLETEVKK